MSRRKSTAPKLRNCVLSWLKSKAKTNTAPQFLLTDAVQARMS
jgi:hypothetical protein